jgi:hypothetical protein
MAASHLPVIPLPAPLNTTSSQIALDWKRFASQWNNYVKAAKLDKEPTDCQAAILLACIGVEAYRIFEAMDLTNEQREDPKAVIEAFQITASVKSTKCMNGSSSVPGNRTVVNRSTHLSATCGD